VQNRENAGGNIGEWFSDYSFVEEQHQARNRMIPGFFAPQFIS
jgi:hypothetical protein